mgnify:CR=1 FL=1
MRDKKVTFIVQAAVIAALYVVLTFVANALGLASHTIQVRFSEALCILPVFTPAAIPGLWIGCLLANLLTGAVIYDVIFGSIATLLAAVCTYLLRNHKIACTFPPVIFNMPNFDVVKKGSRLKAGCNKISHHLCIFQGFQEAQETG